MVFALKHCILDRSDLSPSLRNCIMEFSRPMKHVAAWLGSSLLLLSEIAWIDFRVLSWKLMCIRGSPNVFSKVAHAVSIEVFQSGGTRSAAFPVRAPWSLPSWSVFEILLLSIALLNLSLKSTKSSLGVTAYLVFVVGRACRSDRRTNLYCCLLLLYP